MKVIWNVANKEGYPKILYKLKEIERKQPKNSRGKGINFPRLFQFACGALCLKKKELWTKLNVLNEIQLLKIVPFHSVKLNFRIVEDE